MGQVGKTSSEAIWRSIDGEQYFLLPRHYVSPPGSLVIMEQFGTRLSVDPDAVAPFEMTEDQARRWAKDQLGRTLEELKEGLDEKLGELRQKVEAIKRQPVSEGTTVTPEAPAALLSLLTQLPGVIGQSLSGDDTRVENARKAMADLQQRLKKTGIDLDDRFTRFPDRLAELRKEAEREKKEG